MPKSPEEPRSQTPDNTAEKKEDLEQLRLNSIYHLQNWEDWLQPMIAEADRSDPAYTVDEALLKPYVLKSHEEGGGFILDPEAIGRDAALRRDVLTARTLRKMFEGRGGPHPLDFLQKQEGLLREAQGRLEMEQISLE